MADDGGGRFAQLRLAIAATAKNDPKFVPLVLAGSLGTAAIVVVVGVLIGHVISFAILAVLLGLIVALIITGRRATSAQFASIEGQPGAAAAVLSAMRGNWRVTPAVEFTRNQDLLHRVIGRPGIVLVAEGSPARARELIGNHARRVRRVAGDTPIYDVLVGDGEGQVGLRKLQAHMMKLPRNIKPKEVNDLERRLKAIGGPSIPIPKGPMPRSGKIPKKMRR
ncbi:MAG: DUF4191 domain-containing protein [Frankia sp.]|nr:DUF4191 domain-containing protein [Frankia sp.]